MEVWEGRTGESQWFSLLLLLLLLLFLESFSFLVFVVERVRLESVGERVGK